MASVPPEGFARVMPAARRSLSDSGLQAVQVQGTGPGGRILKEDVERAARAVPGVTDARVEIVFDPPWDSCKMSEAARLQLGLL